MPLLCLVVQIQMRHPGLVNVRPLILMSLLFHMSWNSVPKPTYQSSILKSHLGWYRSQRFTLALVLGPRGGGSTSNPRLMRLCKLLARAVESDHLSVGWVECLTPNSLICPHLILLEGVYLLFKDLLYICWCYICDFMSNWAVCRQFLKSATDKEILRYVGSRSPHLVCCDRSWKA